MCVIVSLSAARTSRLLSSRRRPLARLLACPLAFARLFVRSFAPFRLFDPRSLAAHLARNATLQFRVLPIYRGPCGETDAKSVLRGATTYIAVGGHLRVKLSNLLPEVFKGQGD